MQKTMDSLNKQTIKEVVVVEGYHDLACLKEIYPDLDVVITNGSEVSENTLGELKHLNKERGLILFLDPDMQGERIRRLINDYVGNTLHAFIPKDKSISKNKQKVGVEHASKETIIYALENVQYSRYDAPPNITTKQLIQLGLMGTKNAKQKRKILAEHLNIGPANAKTFCKKLNMFHITLEELENALGEIIWPR